MSEPRRHHLVPQMHLKRFADNKRRIGMISRDQKLSVTTHIKNAAVELDYYAVETSNGISREVEGLLSRIESNAEHAIERMIHGVFPPSEADRDAAAQFIAFQCLRGRETRENIELVTDAIAKFYLTGLTGDSLRGVLRKLLGREIADAELREHQAFLGDAEAYTVTPHRNDHVIAMLDAAPGLANIMAERTWILSDLAEPCLITSDAPVANWSAPNPAQYGVGWGNVDEVQMPLSPRFCLVLTHRKDLRDQVFRWGSMRGPEQAAKMNRVIAERSHRWIFHYPGTTPLKGVTLDPRSPSLTFDGPLGKSPPEGE